MSEIEIRRATAADAPEIAKAERLYIDCPWTEAQIESEIESSQALFFVARSNGEFAGYLSGVCAADECEVSNIAVSERFRRRKVATALFTELIGCAAKRGIKRLFLLVRTDNAAAIALYKSLNFAVVGTRKRYYKNADAYIMKLDVTAAG